MDENKLVYKGFTIVSYGTTPDGGDRSELTYLDENGEPCDEEHAVNGEIHEMQGDKVIFSPYSIVESRQKARKKPKD